MERMTRYIGNVNTNRLYAARIDQRTPSNRAKMINHLGHLEDSIDSLEKEVRLQTIKDMIHRVVEYNENHQKEIFESDNSEFSTEFQTGYDDAATDLINELRSIYAELMED